MLASKKSKVWVSCLLLVAFLASPCVVTAAQEQPTEQPASTTAAQEQQKRLQAETEKVIAALHSEVLKTESRKQAPRLVSRDVLEARAAVDFFHDLKAQGLLVYALENRSGGYATRNHIVRALQEIARVGDTGLAESATSRLERTVGLMVSGGGESQLAFAQYRQALVQLLEKVMGRTLVENVGERFPTEEEVAKAVSMSKEWLVRTS